jgi:hypothetical protein
VNLRLGQVEAAAVLIVKVSDILVRDANVRSNLQIEQLLHTEVTPELCSQLLNRHLAGSELLLELFLRVGRLQLLNLRSASDDSHQTGFFPRCSIISLSITALKFLGPQQVWAKASSDENASRIAVTECDNAVVDQKPQHSLE